MQQLVLLAPSSQTVVVSAVAAALVSAASKVTLVVVPAAASFMAPKIALKTQRSAAWGLHPLGRVGAGMAKLWP